MRKIGIQVTIIYVDEGLIEFQVRASNGRFAGQAELYAPLEILAEFAGVLRGFPTSHTDTRKFELGTFDEAYGGGGVSFHFYCIDSLGHAMAKVKFRDDSRRWLGAIDVADFHISVEAAAIDSFTGELEKIISVVGQTAFLDGID